MDPPPTPLRRSPARSAAIPGHPAELDLTHPRTGARIALTSALPSELQAFLEVLDKIIRITYLKVFPESKSCLQCNGIVQAECDSSENFLLVVNAKIIINGDGISLCVNNLQGIFPNPICRA